MPSLRSFSEQAPFAFLPQYILRRANPKRRSYRRIDGFEGRYTAAIKAFITRPPDPRSASEEPSAPGDPSLNPSRQGVGHVDDAKAGTETGPEPSLPWQQPMMVDFEGIATALRLAAKRYWRSTVYFDDTTDAYKELEQSLEYVEDDIACLRAPERLSEKLLALKTALDELAEFLNTEFYTLEAPRFVVPLAALLKGPAPPSPPAKEGTLQVGQALATADAADAGIVLIASWRALADELVSYRKWWLRLMRDSKHSPSSHATWEAGHLARLNQARSWLAQAEHELLNVADADGLAQFDTAADIKRAYGHLAYLSDLHGHWPLRHATSTGDSAGASPADTAAAYPSNQPEWPDGSAGFAELLRRISSTPWNGGKPRPMKW